MKSLPKYSGRFPICPKCGNMGADVKYIGPRAEYLSRTCELCGYQWKEACADTEEEAMADESEEKEKKGEVGRNESL